jgi:tripartite-type tricarboxylate transporter receptor subunit TctC
MKKLLSAAILLFAGLSSAHAQYPTKPIRLVVGFPPGGSADPTARALAAPLQEQLGQPVLVENRPGGDSAIGADYVAKAAPDGYTLFYGSSSAMVAAVALRKVPPYDPLKDFTSIGMVGRAMQILYVYPGVPAQTLKEFIAHARANPGKLNYASGNPLAIFYYANFMAATGTQLTHIPYKGEGPLTTDLVAGRVETSILSNPAGVSLAKEGRLRVLAVIASNRVSVLPDVPTIAEAGVPEMTPLHWAGIFGPAGMPRAVVERLNKEINVALKTPQLLGQFERYAYTAEGSTPERLAELNRDDLALWRKMIKETNMAIE